MNDLVPAENEKNNAFSNILRFMTDSDIVLSAAEDKILDRWIYVDVRLRERKFKTDVLIDMIRTKFGVSKYTAQSDISNTQLLFASARKFSKAYALMHHAEEIAMQIERIKHDKSLSHLLPKLNDSYTKAVAAIPEERGKNVLPPPVFIFNLPEGVVVERKLTIDQAREMAKEKLLKKSNPDYTDYEDLPNKPGNT